MDIVINNISGGEDVSKKKSKNKIINVIIIAVVVSSLAFGLISYNATKSQNKTITSKTTETLYVQSYQCDYVLNTNTMKVHKPDCKYVDNIDDKNRENYYGTVEEIQSQGYSPCGHCHPW